MSGKSTMWRDGTQVNSGSQVEYVATETLTREKYPNIPNAFIGTKYHVVKNISGALYIIPENSISVPVEKQKPYEEIFIGPETNMLPEGVYSTLHAPLMQESGNEPRLMSKYNVAIDPSVGNTFDFRIKVTNQTNGYGGIRFIYGSGNENSVKIISDGTTISITVPNAENGQRTIINESGEDVFFRARLDRGEINDTITLYRLAGDNMVVPAVDPENTPLIFKIKGRM